MSIMNGLLHSKTFRKNLSRWIFMYIAVICLLTSVITYSKYISSLGVHDEVRASKFNVLIEPMDIDSECSQSSVQGESLVMSCGSKRPTSVFNYYFKVVSEVEVPSSIILRVSGGDNRNYKKENDDISSMKIQSINLCKDNTCENFKDTKVIDSISGLYEFDVSTSTKTSLDEYYFKVVAQFDSEKFDRDSLGNVKYSVLNGTDQINIGYSAIQISGDGLATKN